MIFLPPGESFVDNVASTFSPLNLSNKIPSQNLKGSIKTMQKIPWILFNVMPGKWLLNSILTKPMGCYLQKSIKRIESNRYFRLTKNQLIFGRMIWRYFPDSHERGLGLPLLMLWLSTKRSSCDSNYSTFCLPWAHSLHCPSKNFFLFSMRVFWMDSEVTQSTINER